MDFGGGQKPSGLLFDFENEPATTTSKRQRSTAEDCQDHLLQQQPPQTRRMIGMGLGLGFPGSSGGGSNRTTSRHISSSNDLPLSVSSPELIIGRGASSSSSSSSSSSESRLSSKGSGSAIPSALAADRSSIGSEGVENESREEVAAGEQKIGALCLGVPNESKRSNSPARDGAVVQAGEGGGAGSRSSSDGQSSRPVEQDPDVDEHELGHRLSYLQMRGYDQALLDVMDEGILEESSEEYSSASSASEELGLTEQAFQQARCSWRRRSGTAAVAAPAAAAAAGAISNERKRNGGFVLPSRRSILSAAAAAAPARLHLHLKSTRPSRGAIGDRIRARWSELIAPAANHQPATIASRTTMVRFGGSLLVCDGAITPSCPTRLPLFRAKIAAPLCSKSAGSPETRVVAMPVMEDGGSAKGDAGRVDGTSAEMERLRARVAELEAENDLLAVAATREPELLADVNRLTARVAELEEENKALLSEANNGRLAQGGGGGRNTGSGGSNGSHGAGLSEDPAAPFVVPGDRSTCLRRVSNTLVACHGGTNVLCARACPSLPSVVASGGADMSLQVSRLVDEAKDSDDDGSGTGGASSTELRRLKLAAPVLSMDFCPASAPVFGGGGGTRGLLLAGGMDGGSHLISIDESSSSSSGSGSTDAVSEDGGDGDEGGSGGNKKSNGVALLASMKNHAKYLVVCRWAPDGRAFVTASHDKVVTLYTLRAGGDGTGLGGVGGTGYEQATQLYFPEAVESAEFVRGEGGALELVVSARGQPHLTYIDVETLQQRRVSLNEKEWDTHVSFTVMSMAASADGKYLLAATDKSRNILWRAGTNTRVRTLLGHTTDDYFQPRVQWDPSGMFSFCNSSGDHDLHVHCLASGRVVERLKGHGAVIRDIHHDPSRKMMLTASYDKTVKVWGEG
eukprot:g13151.t1